MSDGIRIACKESIKVDAGCFGPYVCWKRAGHNGLHEAEIDVYPGNEKTEVGVVRWPNRQKKSEE